MFSPPYTPRLGARGFSYFCHPMHLPLLATGKRFTLPRPPGSADALLLAQLAEREKAAGRITAIVTSDATDAQRLLEEITFFAPDLRCALFPDWETLPYDSFSLDKNNASGGSAGRSGSVCTMR